MSITTTSNPIVLGIDNEQEDSRPAQRPVTPPGHAIEQIGSAGSSPLSSLPSSLLSPRPDVIGLPSSPRLTSTYPDLSNSTEPQPPAGFTAIQSTESLSAPEVSPHSLPTPSTSSRRSVYPPLSQEDEEEIERLTSNVAGYLQDFRDTTASVRPRSRKLQRFCWTLRPSTKMTETAEDAKVQRGLPDMDAGESQTQPSRWIYDTESELWTYLQPDHPTVHHTTPEARSDPSQGSPMELTIGKESAPEVSLAHEQDTTMELVTERESIRMNSLPSSAGSGHDFETESSLRRQDSRNITAAREEEPRTHKAIKTLEQAADEIPGPNDRNATATDQENAIVIRAPSIADHILQALTAKKKVRPIGVRSLCIVLIMISRRYISAPAWQLYSMSTI
ncbi:hypothetical protein BDY17DRAFT_134003 [Neohortaea acidophila]|uniref:Uncharacterized protein n=1 Tax=Neohortaea acidophila TaxID=245834 RepID=A0A6A6PXD7_9PEZI|nr:uncharacterized protein BDY17DRAFT_134003 [Neohortaea acidophila]KAF2484702.1 hypothetical protein BDY17DRAFT_134003 [Neohortaea acidophila]